MPQFFHRTSWESAQNIRRDGFRDGTATYGMGREYTGVWISNVPLDENDGAHGDTLLGVTLDDSTALAPYELVEEQRGYRSWLVPAELLNRQATVDVVERREEPPEWAR